MSPVSSKPVSARVLDAAIAWQLSLDSGDGSAVEQEEFAKWLASNEEHARAWRQLGMLDQRFSVASGPARAALLQSREGIRRRVRKLGSGLASVVLVCGLALFVGQRYVPLNYWLADQRTATGEQRTLALSAGVDVTLNTRTSVRRQTDGGKLVGLELITGEAAIDSTGAGRAFAVVAGVGRSLLESGRFEVRHLNGKVCVTCIEGSVRMEHPAGALQLHARQQIVYGARSVGGIASIDPKTVSAWRQGILVFNQTRLDDALDEINRYRPGRVVLLNDAVRSKPVSGRFATASLDLALWQLQESFQLRARALPAGLLVLS